MPGPYSRGEYGNNAGTMAALRPSARVGGSAPPAAPSSGSVPYWSPSSKFGLGANATTGNDLPMGGKGAPIGLPPRHLDFSGGVASTSPWESGNDILNVSGDISVLSAGTDGLGGETPFPLDTSATLPAPPKRSLQTVGIPEPIRHYFQTLDMETLKQMRPDDERYKEIPMKYISAFPLDDPSVQRRAGGSFGYSSAVYKVIDNTDSQVYALRRIDNVRTSQGIIQNALSKWSSIRHPSIVSLYSIAYEKGALFFTHAYNPGAQTLKQRFIDQRGSPLAETLLWRILIELLVGIRATHSHGVAVRAIGPSRILLVSGTRVRINCVGISDVIEFESRRAVSDLQLDDLVKTGFLMLSLATRTMVTPAVVEQAVAMAQVQYSPAFNQVIELLLSGRAANINAVCAMVPMEKWCDELDLSLAASDGLHAHLRTEYEAGRLLRLLVKLGMINERPEHSIAGARDWSETGDRYILKLFRDFLFHQTILDGSAPSVDAGHVIASLNKLDLADAEKILLSSRNNKDLLVVSYADVHRCLDDAFSELVRMSDMAQSAAAGTVGGVPVMPSSAGGVGAYSGSMDPSSGMGMYDGGDFGMDAAGGQPMMMQSSASGSMMMPRVGGGGGSGMGPQAFAPRGGPGISMSTPQSQVPSGQQQPSAWGGVQGPRSGPPMKRY